MSFFVCLSGNSSHTIVPKGLNFSGFEGGGHLGVVIRKFGEDQFVR